MSERRPWAQRVPFGVVFGALVGAAGYAVARRLDWPGLASVERATGVVAGGVVAGLVGAWWAARRHQTADPIRDKVDAMSQERFDDFKRRFEAHGTDPEAVIKLLVEALCVCEEDDDLGQQMMAVVMSKRDLTETPGTLSGFSLPKMNQVPRRLAGNRNIARSYAGGTWQNDYKDYDPSNLRVQLDKAYSARAQGVDYPEPGRAKFFVASGGADSPRPVQLARNNAGYWKVTEFSSLSVGVRQGQQAAGDF